MRAPGLRRNGFVFVALAMAAPLLACGSSQKQQIVGACKTDADCTSGQTCNIHGFCQASLGCHKDADCGANKTCDVPSGACLCANDQGCDPGQFCNASHRCQGVGTCQGDSDCQPAQICSTATHTCIPATSCGGTVQCPLAQVCDPMRNLCVPGCRDSGDCPQTAVDGGVTVFAPQGCIQGQCQPGKCTDNSGCQFEQVCNANTCATSCTSNTPFCKACDPTSLFPACGGAKNMCLIDPRNDSSCMAPSATCKFWCGIDCSNGQPCPSGFDCGDIIIVTQTTQCNCGTTCSNGTGPCQCGEGATSGYCLCTNDTECGAPISGATCVNGNCLLGKNCFPAKGLYCDSPGPPCP